MIEPNSPLSLVAQSAVNTIAVASSVSFPAAPPPPPPPAFDPAAQAQRQAQIAQQSKVQAEKKELRKIYEAFVKNNVDAKDKDKIFRQFGYRPMSAAGDNDNPLQFDYNIAPGLGFLLKQMQQNFSLSAQQGLDLFLSQTDQSHILKQFDANESFAKDFSEVHFKILKIAFISAQCKFFKQSSDLLKTDAKTETESDKLIKCFGYEKKPSALFNVERFDREIKPVLGYLLQLMQQQEMSVAEVQEALLHNIKTNEINAYKVEGQLDKNEFQQAVRDTVFPSLQRMVKAIKDSAQIANKPAQISFKLGGGSGKMDSDALSKGIANFKPRRVVGPGLFDKSPVVNAEAPSNTEATPIAL